MKYDLLVFIGRFQPLHSGHEKVIEKALSLSNKVLVLIGSANVAPNPRNPFTYEQRAEMIKQVFPKVETRPLNDHTYNDSAWTVEVQNHVRDVLLPKGKWSASGLNDFRIGLIGCEKDHTSYYLKMFPQWNNENVTFVNPLSATHIRERFFLGQDAERHLMATNMHIKTVDWLLNFKNGPNYKPLADTVKFIIDYREKWGKGPFLTADSLVQVGGNILLIKRGKEYGHGLLALPGGFVNEHETFRNASVRELREETNLRVPIPVLKGSTKSSKTFDDPHRSERGRLVTQCFHYLLENDVTLPEVRGGDDADSADWYEISWVLDNSKLFFEDHYHIIKNMLGVS